MNAPADQEKLTPAERRRALGLGHVNGALWSIGNGLTTGPMVYFLAIDLGAQGRQIGWLFAAPSLAGLLRLAAPAVIRRAGSAKRACLGVLLASYLLILGLPLCGVAPQWLPKQTALTVLVALLCVHQLLEYIGTVALWTWLGDLVSLRIRGRYFARRQMIQLGVLIPTLLASGYFADRWRTLHADEPNLLLLGYAIPNALGAACLLGCLAPLVKMPSTPPAMRSATIAWRAILAPFADAQFRRVLWFRVWLSLSNGITQTVQGIYPKQVLKLGVQDLAIMKTCMLAGQFGLARPVGRLSDRWGNRPLLVAGQIGVAGSLGFFLIARSPANAWWVLGAWLLWSAYVAHNICLPNLVLELAPAESRAGYLAATDALGSFFHAAATIAGGYLFDWLKADPSQWTALGWSLDPFATLFVIGIAMRLLAVPLAAAIRERRGAS